MVLGRANDVLLCMIWEKLAPVTMNGPLIKPPGDSPLRIHNMLLRILSSDPSYST
jgi:hypothetical protein